MPLTRQTRSGAWIDIPHSRHREMASAWVAVLPLPATGAEVSVQSLEFELNRDWPQSPLGDNWLTGGIGVDSRGNVYIAEQAGRRIQQFVPVAPCSA